MAKKKKASTIDEKQYLRVETDEQWLHTVVGRNFYDNDFYRIIDFFVLHSPCKGASYSPRTLESLGWKNPWHSSRFRNAFDEIMGLVENVTFQECKEKNHFLEMWNQMGIKDFFSINGAPYAIVIHAGEYNPRMDLLHHIRNSFAHGRFSVIKEQNEYYIFLEDVSSIRNLTGLYVTARICIKKSALLRVIDFFEKKDEESQKLVHLFQK